MRRITAAGAIFVLVIGISAAGCGGGGGITASDGHKGVGEDCYERVESFIRDDGVEVPDGLDIEDVGDFIEESCEESSPTTTIERAAVHAMFLARVNQLANGEL
jgi:hypothetical protein